jgi:hypothetical protein
VVFSGDGTPRSGDDLLSQAAEHAADFYCFGGEGCNNPTRQEIGVSSELELVLELAAGFDADIEKASELL